MTVEELLTDPELFYDCAADALLMAGPNATHWRASCERIRSALLDVYRYQEIDRIDARAAQHLADVLFENLRSYENE